MSVGRFSTTVRDDVRLGWRHQPRGQPDHIATGPFGGVERGIRRSDHAEQVVSVDGEHRPPTDTVTRSVLGA